MAREDERAARAREQPIVGSLPAEAPGILAAMKLSPALATHLRGLADALLVAAYPGATLTRGERELIATAVSGANNCFYCMDTHGAFAAEVLARGGMDAAPIADLVDGAKCATDAGQSVKMRALLAIARAVQRDARSLERATVTQAIDAGASDADTQLAVLIASAFCMYNRMVDGLRSPTPADPDAYKSRAVQIADHGYSDAKVTAIPR